MDNTTTTTAAESQGATKFCKHCGQKVMEAAVICPHCGCQIEEVKKTEQPSIVINNSNANMNTNTNINGGPVGKPKNKWVALLLCFFFGYLGAHKFYEGRIGAGILYILTVGIFGIGALIDFIALLFKKSTYYV